VKHTPRLDAREFERLANLTRLGSMAREMARLTLVKGQSMHEVAKGFDTIPQRVRLAVVSAPSIVCRHPSRGIHGGGRCKRPGPLAGALNESS
jgi:hypothetical protein